MPTLPLTVWMAYQSDCEDRHRWVAGIFTTKEEALKVATYGSVTEVPLYELADTFKADDKRKREESDRAFKASQAASKLAQEKREAEEKARKAFEKNKREAFEKSLAAEWAASK